jgi:hypothetical protein
VSARSLHALANRPLSPARQRSIAVVGSASRVNNRALFPSRAGAIAPGPTAEARSMYDDPYDFNEPATEFEIERDGGEPENAPWGPEHPLWLQFKRGECKIVRGPDGADYLVPKEAYTERTQGDTIPLECFAQTNAQAILDQPASLSQIRYQYGKSLAAFAAADMPLGAFSNASPPAGNVSPLNQEPAQPGGANTPNIGGAILVASLDFGFGGAQSKYMFDLPPGLTVKAPFSGNFGRLNAKLMPKYYTNVDGAGVRQYLQAPGGNVLTTELWNAESSALMAANGFTNNNPAPCRGWISLGEGLSNDTQGKPTRRFYGSVLTTGAVAGQITRCPVAQGASWVMLVGGRFDPVAAQVNALAMVQNGPLSPQAITSQATPAGVIVPLIDNVQSISVFETTSGAAPKDIPFELVFFLGF